MATRGRLIEPHTVNAARTRVRIIYRKVEVAARRKCCRRARELRLL